jgi:DNA-binding response OmpR family regulator
VDRITEGEAVILDRNIDVHVSAIRKKLGEASKLVGTVRGVGYKLKD